MLLCRTREHLAPGGMQMKVSWLAAAVIGLAGVAGGASASVWKLDVTVDGHLSPDFSFPYFTFTNLSSGGAQISQLGVSNGPPWDWIDTVTMIMPAGGSRTLLQGEERANSNPDNGCTAGITYGLTGFDPGEAFGFAADPEGPGCGSAVIDVRPGFLANDQLTVSVAFDGGPTLSGSDWTLELIDPNGSPTAGSNQRYRLTLQAGVPEPATWALMILGFGATGAALRRRVSALQAASSR
jgi:hypothetical protein